MTDSWCTQSDVEPLDPSQRVAFSSLSHPQHSQPAIASCLSQSLIGNDCEGISFSQLMDDGCINNHASNEMQSYPFSSAWPYANTGVASMMPGNGTIPMGVDPRQLQGYEGSMPQEQATGTTLRSFCSPPGIQSQPFDRPSGCSTPSSFCLDFNSPEGVSSSSDFQHSSSNSPMPIIDQDSCSGGRHFVDDDTNEANEPYNKLLFRCLKSAPNHELQLKEIYNWFRQNTSKGRIPNQKGWQNSIRHNLSMNKVRD